MKNFMLKIIAGLLVLVIPIATIATGNSQAPREGAVASLNILASQVVAEMLAKGGTAIDAAIATHFVLNVVAPYFANLGGASYIIIHNEHTGQTYAIDGREQAPSAATPTMFIDAGLGDEFELATVSGIAVGVYGTPKAMEKAYKIGGKLP